MSKLHIALAGATALVLAGVAEADEPRDNPARQAQTQQRDDQSRRDNPRERNDESRQEQPGGDMSGNQQVRPYSEAMRRAEEFSAELKKCDQLSDDRQAQCIESVRRNFGEM